MRDEKYCTAVRADEALEPLECIGVEMVGRLVEKKDIRTRNDETRKTYAHLLATGETGDGPCVIDVRKTETCQGGLHAGLIVISA